MKLNDVKKAFDYLFAVGITPLLVGHRGCGKSECVKQYAKENGYGLVDIRLGQAEGAGDLVGLADFIKDPETGQNTNTKFMAPHFLPTKGKWIIFLDEINRANKDVLQAVFELVYDGSISINDYSLPKGSQVVAAMNPPTEEYSVLNFEDSAFLDRFCQIKFEPTVDEWLSFIKNKEGSSALHSFIFDRPELLEPEMEEFKLNIKPSRRSWLGVLNLEKYCQSDKIFEEICYGLIGVEATVSYLQFKKDRKNLADPATVLDDFSSIRDSIATWSSMSENRNDILTKLNKSLVDYILTNDLTLTTQQEDNLVSYLKLIPKDLAFCFLETDLPGVPNILKTERNSEHGLYGNEDLLKYMTGVIESNKDKNEND